MARYEEYKIVSTFWAWVILWSVSLFIVGYGLMLHFLVKEGPRSWNFYSIPITPAQSEYSTRLPPPQNVPPTNNKPPTPPPPPQIEPLPEGIRFEPPSQSMTGPATETKGARP